MDCGYWIAIYIKQCNY